MCLVNFDWMLDIYSGHGWYFFLAKRIHPIFSWENVLCPPVRQRRGRSPQFDQKLRMVCCLYKAWRLLVVSLSLTENVGIYFCFGRSWTPNIISLASQASWKLSSAIAPLFAQHISLLFYLIKNYQIIWRESRWQGTGMLLSFCLPSTPTLDPQVLIGPSSPCWVLTTIFIFPGL